MKKILFSAAALALLATAGCTRNEDNGVKGDAQRIAFTGEFAAADEFDRVEFVPTTNWITQPINWNPGDKIGICYATDPAWQGFNNPYVATTTTAANTTKFEVDPEGTPIEMDKNTTTTFYAYYPYNVDYLIPDGHSVNHLPSPLMREQKGDPATNSYPNASFLVASKDYAGEDVVSFKFSNVFPVMMISFEGDAQINKVRIDAPIGCNIYGEGFVDITKVPAKGANFDEFTAEFFDCDPVSRGSSIEVTFDTPLNIVDGESTYFPVMVAPFDYIEGQTFTFTIYGEGSDKPIERTITTTKAGTLGAGQCIYIDFYNRISKDEFEGGDVPGPGPVDPGQVLFEDDFSYICSIFDNPENVLDKYGWTENRSQWPVASSHERYAMRIEYKVPNFIKATADDKAPLNAEGKHLENLMNAKGWTMIGSNFGYYRDNGMIRLGNGMYFPGMTLTSKQLGEITLPLAGIVGDESTDVTLTFRAARNTDRYGLPEVAASKLTVRVTGEGTQINGAAEAVLTPQDAFTWYEYTLPITGATAASTITFSNTDKKLVCVYLDNVKLTVANGEAANTEGTAVAKEANDILYTNVAPNYEITINAEADPTDTFGNFIATENERLEFACSGAWYIDSKYPCDEGVDGWVQLSPVNWNDKLDTEEYRLKDMYGNGIRNIIGVAATKANTTGADRTCELTIRDFETYAPIATFTIIQPASDVAPEPVDYGTQVLSVKWDGDSVKNPTKTGSAAAAATVTFGDPANWEISDNFGQAGHNGLGFVNICPTALEHGNMEAGIPYQFEVNVPLAQIPETATKIVVTCDAYKPNFYKTNGNCDMEVAHYGYFKKSIMNIDTADGPDWFTVSNEFDINAWADWEWDEIRIFIYAYVGKNDNGLGNSLIDNVCVYYK